jgi:dTDP-4-dehydrorhamnose 3,5-epimerase
MAAGQAGSTVMKATQASLEGVLVLRPRVFGDERGFFLESYNQRMMEEVGIREPFVQDNHSFSTRNVLRGLHYQVQRPQGKLVRVIGGEILDVVVDLRRSSPTFGGWEAIRLSEENKSMLWIPAGFAHGFRVVSESVHVLYKTTDFYFPEFEHTVAWNDPALKIDWQLDGNPIISKKDQAGIPFKQAQFYE